MNSHNKVRVKFCSLSEQNQFTDKGTGYAFTIYNNLLDSVILVVRSEIDDSILLASRISPYLDYKKQQDTLITWSESDKNELALCFENKVGCDEIWQRICEVSVENFDLTI